MVQSRAFSPCVRDRARYICRSLTTGQAPMTAPFFRILFKLFALLAPVALLSVFLTPHVVYT